MALVRVHYDTPIYIAEATKACNRVALCLDPAVWAGSQTVAELSMIFATVQNSGRPLGSGGGSFSPPWENPRCEDHYEYIFEYDDSQITDPQEIVECKHIVDVISACILDTFLLFPTP